MREMLEMPSWVTRLSGKAPRSDCDLGGQGDVDPNKGRKTIKIENGSCVLRTAGSEAVFLITCQQKGRKQRSLHEGQITF